jgi:hypothetical protein
MKSNYKKLFVILGLSASVAIADTSGSDAVTKVGSDIAGAAAAGAANEANRQANAAGASIVDKTTNYNNRQLSPEQKDRFAGQKYNDDHDDEHDQRWHNGKGDENYEHGKHNHKNHKDKKQKHKNYQDDDEYYTKN